MTALFFILFGAGIILFALLSSRPKSESHNITITCDLKHGGSLDAYIHYEAPPENPIVPSMEPIVRCWALRLEKPAISPYLYFALNREIGKFGAHATKLSISGVPETETPEPVLTAEEEVHQEINEAERKLVTYCDRMDSLDPKLKEKKIGQDSIADLLKSLMNGDIRRIVDPSGSWNYRSRPRPNRRTP